MKRLTDLLRDLDYALHGAATLPPDLTISAITPDSRQVEAGTLFVAYRGVSTDSHRFVPMAVTRGAAAVVVEIPPDEPLPVPVIVVPNGREALAWIAAAWYDHPACHLTTIGITGTDGKTTTSHLTASILAAMGRSYGMVSTIGARIGSQELDTGFHTTTPDALPLQAYLAEMVASEAEVAVLEVTSHSLAHYRVESVAFDVAAVTNITHEHLDAHGSIEAYRAAKTHLFELLSAQRCKPDSPRVAVLNLDDSSYEYLSRQPAAHQLSYSAKGNPGADLRAQDIVYGNDGTRFLAQTPIGAVPIHSPLLGPFNVANILAAMGIGIALGATAAALASGVAALQRVHGRMDGVELGQDFLAVVDFAHTPNALANALQTARLMVGPDHRVITVFGCAGLRDIQKREMMGAIAARFADLTVITAEDPRTEDLDAIMEAIAVSARSQGAVEGQDYVKIGDRAEAIAWAVSQARTGDIVIACGKGHEQSMCYGEIEYPWDEHAAMRAGLERRLAQREQG